MDQAQKITVLIIPANASPAYLRHIEPTLGTLQALVGGSLEELALTSDAVMYVNEDGKTLGLPVNADANKVIDLLGRGLLPAAQIVGDVVIVGTRTLYGRHDGEEHDVPSAVPDLCRTSGIPVEDHRTTTP